MINQYLGWTLNGTGASRLVNRWNGGFWAWCVCTLFAVLSICNIRGADTPLAVTSVTASAHDGNVPANTVDGSLSTRWSASGDGQWIQYDLGVNRAVGSVAIAWYQGDQRTTRFDVRTSLDQITWTPVFSGVSSGTTTGFETYDVLDSTARYVSIVGHGNSVNLWNSISEVDLFPPADSTTLNWNLVSGAMFKLQWNCEAGSVCQVQASSNFVTWADVSPLITSTTGTQTWEENVATLPTSVRRARYYRVKKISSPQKPTLTVVSSDASASEGGANPGTFTFSRTGSTASSLTARYSIGGTAANGADYTTLSGSVIIPSGSAVATVAISPVDDTSVEGNQTVVLTVSSDSAYTVGSPNSATVTIADNDSAAAPTVTVAASDASASESGPNPATFTFSRSGSSTAALTVRYSVGGTASNGSDYASLSGSLSIPSGSSSATLTVNPINDTDVESSETVVLTLSADSAYTMGSPSSATVTIADNDSGGGSTLPSSLLNLSNWKLTLPVDTSHAGSPDEIRQPELAGFQDSNYFYVNGARDGVVFTAHCGGATTSGSGYPRSELREMTSGGSANASWSTTSGTHTMEIRQAITHLPVTKPHVVAGQIHDASDDVIVFRLEGSTLFVDENGGRGPVLTSNYQLGTVFTTKFVARNGGVEIYYNGQYIYTYSVSTSGCYFKAGCYTQSNTDRGDSASAYGQVVIYNLTITHQ